MMYASIAPFFECIECKENDRVREKLKVYMNQLLDIAYSEDPFKEWHFECCLDEMCFLLCVPFRKEKLQIERKNSSLKKISEAMYELSA